MNAGHNHRYLPRRDWALIGERNIASMESDGPVNWSCRRRYNTPSDYWQSLDAARPFQMKPSIWQDRASSLFRSGWHVRLAFSNATVSGFDLLFGAGPSGPGTASNPSRSRTGRTEAFSQ